MSKEKRFIAVYFLVREPENGWVQLETITKLHGEEDRYYYGLEARQMSELEFNENMEMGLIRRLHLEPEIWETHGLWLAPDGRVWLARNNDPANDKNKVKVYELLAIPDPV